MNQAQYALQNFLNNLMQGPAHCANPDAEKIVADFRASLVNKAVRTVEGKEYTHYIFADNTGVGVKHNSENMLPMQQFKVFAHKAV